MPSDMYTRAGSRLRSIQAFCRAKNAACARSRNICWLKLGSLACSDARSSLTVERIWAIGEYAGPQFEACTGLPTLIRREGGESPNKMRRRKITPPPPPPKRKKGRRNAPPPTPPPPPPKLPPPPK